MEIMTAQITLMRWVVLMAPNTAIKLNINVIQGNVSIRVGYVMERVIAGIVLMRDIVVSIEKPHQRIKQII
jgi:hypothetical protein